MIVEELLAGQLLHLKLPHKKKMERVCPCQQSCLFTGVPAASVLSTAAEEVLGDPPAGNAGLTLWRLNLLQSADLRKYHKSQKIHKSRTMFLLSVLLRVWGGCCSFSRC